MGLLYLVPTPIGNYEDMTLRGVEVLKGCDFIYCLDIEKSEKLLQYYNIERPLYCFKENKEEILSHLNNNKTIALISDEGYSGVDIESKDIATTAESNGHMVIAIPGANYLLTGLVSSGIPCDKFLYFGFLNKDVKIKEKELESIVDFDRTLVFYEYGTYLKETLDVLYNVFGSRLAVLCFNLTLDNETFIRFNLGDNVDYEDNNKKIVIVVEGAKIKAAVQKLNDLDVINHYNYYLEQGLDSKEAMKKTAKDRGVSKSDIYRVINK